MKNENIIPDNYIKYNKPYKFLDSYSLADKQLFFGRKADANNLLLKILYYRFIIFYAQSGAGKTSLINASIIPKLESEGYQIAHIHFGENPIYDTQELVINSLYTSLSNEVKIIKKAASALYDKYDVWKSVTLNDMLEKYHLLKLTNPLKRSLLFPLVNNVLIDNKSYSTQYYPHFIKLLRGSIGINDYSNILRSRGRESKKIFKINENTKIEKLIEYLSNPVAERELNSYFNLISSENSLKSFFNALFKSYNYNRYEHPLPIVLIFDQFEELFTRFCGAYKWQIRDGFLEQIKILNNQKEWPIKIVICIRKEYLANMDFKSLDIDFENSLIDLDLLSIEEAIEAIRKPAKIYGYDYNDEFLKMIIDDLKQEEKFIDPPHLQIVCEKLWEAKGRELFESQSANSNSIIPKDVYENLGRAKGIFGQYFENIIKALPSYEKKQTMNILTRLITSSGTRNIVNRNDMLSFLGKNKERNEKLLMELEKQRLIRTERRLGEPFIEITHDRLVPIITEAETKAYKTMNKYGYLSIIGGLIYFLFGIYFLIKQNPGFGILFAGVALYFIFFAAIVMYKKVPYYAPDPFENLKIRFKNLFRKNSAPSE